MLTNTIFLFLESIGGGELMLILLFVLLFFGSDKIPSLAKGLGKGMREMKDAMNGIQSDIKQSMDNADREINKLKEELPVIESHPMSQPSNVGQPKIVATTEKSELESETKKEQ
jgi:TatA/E family protein of Tat protein translocase